MSLPFRFSKHRIAAKISMLENKGSKIWTPYLLIEPQLGLGAEVKYILKQYGIKQCPQLRFAPTRVETQTRTQVSDMIVGKR